MFVEKETLLFVKNGILYKQVNGDWVFITHLPEDQPYVDAAKDVEQYPNRPFIAPKEYPLGILCIQQGFYTLDNGKLKKSDLQHYKHDLESFRTLKDHTHSMNEKFDLSEEIREITTEAFDYIQMCGRSGRSKFNNEKVINRKPFNIRILEPKIFNGK